MFATLNLIFYPLRIFVDLQVFVTLLVGLVCFQLILVITLILLHKPMRRLLYCGEWIESHALPIYMVHAPDFLGYPDAIRMSKDHPEAVERALKLKKIGTT